MRFVLAIVIFGLLPANTIANVISGPGVISESWPQATSPRRWAEDVLRIEGKLDANDRDKAIALYYWTRLFVMSPSQGTEPYEGPFGREERIITDIPKVMFVYGCGDCDYQARVLEAVWSLYKSDDNAARRITLLSGGHTMAELRWNDSWHAFDPLNGVFFLSEDSPSANVLSFAEQAHADSLLRENENFENRARPFFERVRSWDEPGEWQMHLTLDGFYDNYEAWTTAGSSPTSAFATHSLPSTYPMSDMSWHLPRGMTVKRSWDSSANFYTPQAYANAFGLDGRHYRQAIEWGQDWTHWNAIEDIYNFPKIEPYLKVGSDPSDSDFYNQHTLYLVGSGIINYEADLWSDAYLDAVEENTGLRRANSPPYLRPDATGVNQSITFRIRSPYIIADAELLSAVAQGPQDSASFWLSTDGGSSWDELISNSGKVAINLGKSRLNSAQHSVTGKYDYLIQFRCKAADNPDTVGISRLAIKTFIDGSLNALPRIVDGNNTIHFKINETDVKAPVTIEYRWITGDQEHSHLKTINPEQLRSGEAAYSFNADGLTRCVSYAFSYGLNDSDGNGLPDSWEFAYFNDNGQNPSADFDGDGITNAEEFATGGEPTTEQQRQAFRNNSSGGCQSSMDAPSQATALLILLILLFPTIILLRKRQRRKAD